jgi:hypothetical protein
MRTTRTSVFCLALVCLAHSTGAGQAPATYAYCWGEGGYQYYSPPFEVIAGDHRDARLSFIRYLEQKYTFKGLVRCTTPRTLEVARAELKKVADDAQRGMNLKIESDWVYKAVPASPPAPAVPAPSPVPPAAPAPAATPTAPPPPAPAAVPAAPAAAPVKKTHAVCWADFDPGPRYYSAVFDGTKGDYADWMPGFKNFLGTKYKYGGRVRCTKKPSQAEAQQYWDDMVAAARALTLAGGVKPKIIETGWVYK